MSLIESWSAIHYLSGRLLKEYVSKHSEYKGEPLDYDVLVLNAKEQLGVGRFDQSEREFPLKVFHGKKNFDDGLEYHFNAAVRRFVAAKNVYENDMRLAEKDFTGYEKDQLIYDYGKDMMVDYSCAVQHLAACEVLKAFENSLPGMFSAKGVKARRDKEDVERLVLAAIVKKMLEELRPSGSRGWTGSVIASQEISRKIFELRRMYPLPIPSDEGELFKKVSRLIELDPSVSEVYKDNAKNKHEDPAAKRRVKYPKW